MEWILRIFLGILIIGFCAYLIKKRTNRHILGTTIKICSILITILLSFYLIAFSRYPDLIESKDVNFLNFPSYFNITKDIIYNTLTTDIAPKQNGDLDVQNINKNLIIEPPDTTKKYTHFIVIDRTLSTKENASLPFKKAIEEDISAGNSICPSINPTNFESFKGLFTLYLSQINWKSFLHTKTSKLRL